MSMSDPLADLLTRLRNASDARLGKVEVPSSIIKTRIAEILRDVRDEADRTFVAGFAERMRV